MGKAIGLRSGGLDSTTVLAVAPREGYEVYALTFEYGQRHAVEVQAARRVAEFFNVAEHILIPIDLRVFGGSALTSSEIEVPKNRTVESIGSEIPSTYVPARNTIFLSFALAWSEVLGVSDIFLGVNALDYSGYPDCRQEYIDAYEMMANLATKRSIEGLGSVKIRTPLIALTKAEIIRKGIELGVDYSNTLTCYDPGLQGEACGCCDACVLRMKGFRENGLTDPALYKSY